MHEAESTPSSHKNITDSIPWTWWTLWSNIRHVDTWCHCMSLFTVLFQSLYTVPLHSSGRLSTKFFSMPVGICVHWERSTNVFSQCFSLFFQVHSSSSTPLLVKRHRGIVMLERVLVYKGILYGCWLPILSRCSGVEKKVKGSWCLPHHTDQERAVQHWQRNIRMKNTIFHSHAKMFLINQFWLALLFCIICTRLQCNTVLAYSKQKADGTWRSRVVYVLILRKKQHEMTLTWIFTINDAI